MREMVTLQPVWGARRGGTIFTALVIVTLLSIMILAMLQFAMFQSRQTNRRIEREAVYYAAEAGIDQVIHYFNFPGEYGGSPSDFFEKVGDPASYYYDDDSDGVADQNIYDGLRLTGGSTLSIVDGSTPMADNTMVFGYELNDDVERAWVSSLTLRAPTGSETSYSSRAILVVTSTAENPMGQRRIVRATLGADPPFMLIADAAIISLNNADTDGQGNVHWGEGWFDGDFQLPNGGLNNLTTTEDPWVNFRATGHVLMSSGKYADGSTNGSNTPLPLGAPNYYQPWGIASEDDETPIDPLHTNIWQHTDPDSLSWPEPLDYDFWKNAAQTRGYYYSWNEAGNRLVSGQSGEELTAAEFFSEVNQFSEVTTGASGADQIMPDPTIVFVDTLDGNPPNLGPDGEPIPQGEPGSNMADLVLNGNPGGNNDFFIRGVFYVGGDVHFSVNGMDGLWLQDPAWIEGDPSGAETQQDNVFLNGMFYSEGIMEMQANAVVYGTLFTRGGFEGSGAPEVWYDARLDLGFPFSFNSQVAVVRWEELTPDISGL